MQHRDGVFVFDRDGEVMAFARLEDAANQMESTDVLDGEYETAYTTDGRVVTVSGSRDGAVTVLVSPERDEHGLRARLERSRPRMGFTADANNPVGVANELLRRDWEQLWPRHPKWLRRRLLGDDPPQI